MNIFSKKEKNAEKTKITLYEVLKAHRKRNLDMTQDQMQEEAESDPSIEILKPKIKKGFIQKLETGKITIELAELSDLSNLYGIELLKLLYLFPEAVDTQSYNTLSDDSFMPTPFDIPNAKGACYWVPKYRLVDSPFMLLKLKLEPGGYSPLNHDAHEEDEIIEVIEGNAMIEFHSELSFDHPHRIPLSIGDRIHFKKIRHIIHNTSHESSTLFIYRIINLTNIDNYISDSPKKISK